MTSFYALLFPLMNLFVLSVYPQNLIIFDWMMKLDFCFVLKQDKPLVLLIFVVVRIKRVWNKNETKQSS